MSRKIRLEELQRIQQNLAVKVVKKDSFHTPLKKVTGFDVAFLNDEAVAAAVTVNYDDLQIIEQKAIHKKMSFPYIPAFLGFREGPIIMDLIRELQIDPEILMLDSHGVAHPRLCGCASHVGILADKPTIGVAKKRLCGEYTKKPSQIGKHVPLKYQGSTTGAVLLSKLGCNPLFISVGHKISLDTAIRVVMHCCSGYKSPEPIRLAHEYAYRVRKERLY